MMSSIIEQSMGASDCEITSAPLDSIREPSVNPILIKPQPPNSSSLSKFVCVPDSTEYNSECIDICMSMYKEDLHSNKSMFKKLYPIPSHRFAMADKNLPLSSVEARIVPGSRLQQYVFPPFVYGGKTTVWHGRWYPDQFRFLTRLRSFSLNRVHKKDIYPRILLTNARQILAIYQGYFRNGGCKKFGNDFMSAFVGNFDSNSRAFSQAVRKGISYTAHGGIFHALASAWSAEDSTIKQRMAVFVREYDVLNEICSEAAVEATQHTLSSALTDYTERCSIVVNIVNAANDLCRSLSVPSVVWSEVALRVNALVRSLDFTNKWAAGIKKSLSSIFPSFASIENQASKLHEFVRFIVADTSQSVKKAFMAICPDFITGADSEPDTMPQQTWGEFANSTLGLYGQEYDYTVTSHGPLDVFVKIAESDLGHMIAKISALVSSVGILFLAKDKPPEISFSGLTKFVTEKARPIAMAATAAIAAGKAADYLTDFDTTLTLMWQCVDSIFKGDFARFVGQDSYSQVFDMYRFVAINYGGTPPQPGNLKYDGRNHIMSPVVQRLPWNVFNSTDPHWQKMVKKIEGHGEMATGPMDWEDGLKCAAEFVHAKMDSLILKASPDAELKQKLTACLNKLQALSRGVPFMPSTNKCGGLSLIFTGDAGVGKSRFINGLVHPMCTQICMEEGSKVGYHDIIRTGWKPGKPVPEGLTNQARLDENYRRGRHANLNYLFGKCDDCHPGNVEMSGTVKNNINNSIMQTAETTGAEMDAAAIESKRGDGIKGDNPDRSIMNFYSDNHVNAQLELWSNFFPAAVRRCVFIKSFVRKEYADEHGKLNLNHPVVQKMRDVANNAHIFNYYMVYSFKRLSTATKDFKMGEQMVAYPVEYVFKADQSYGIGKDAAKFPKNSKVTLKDLTMNELACFLEDHVRFTMRRNFGEWRNRETKNLIKPPTGVCKCGGGFALNNCSKCASFTEFSQYTGNLAAACSISRQIPLGAAGVPASPDKYAKFDERSIMVRVKNLKPTDFDHFKMILYSPSLRPVTRSIFRNIPVEEMIYSHRVGKPWKFVSNSGGCIEAGGLDYLLEISAGVINKSYMRINEWWDSYFPDMTLARVYALFLTYVLYTPYQLSSKQKAENIIPGSEQSLCYSLVAARVCEFAIGIDSPGVKLSDRLKSSNSFSSSDNSPAENIMASSSLLSILKIYSVFHLLERPRCKDRIGLCPDSPGQSLDFADEIMVTETAWIRDWLRADTGVSMSELGCHNSKEYYLDFMSKILPNTPLPEHEPARLRLGYAHDINCQDTLRLFDICFFGDGTYSPLDEVVEPPSYTFGSFIPEIISNKIAEFTANVGDFVPGARKEYVPGPAIQLLPPDESSRPRVAQEPFPWFRPSPEDLLSRRGELRSDIRNFYTAHGPLQPKAYWSRGDVIEDCTQCERMENRAFEQVQRNVALARKVKPSVWEFEQSIYRDTVQRANGGLFATYAPERMKCPRCKSVIVAHPDGHIDSYHEGNCPLARGAAAQMVKLDFTSKPGEGGTFCVPCAPSEWKGFASNYHAEFHLRSEMIIERKESELASENDGEEEKSQDPALRDCDAFSMRRYDGKTRKSDEIPEWCDEELWDDSFAIRAMLTYDYSDNDAWDFFRCLKELREKVVDSCFYTMNQPIKTILLKTVVPALGVAGLAALFRTIVNRGQSSDESTYTTHGLEKPSMHGTGKAYWDIKSEMPSFNASAVNNATNVDHGARGLNRKSLEDKVFALNVSPIGHIVRLSPSWSGPGAMYGILMDSTSFVTNAHFLADAPPGKNFSVKMESWHSKKQTFISEVRQLSWNCVSFGDGKADLVRILHGSSNFRVNPLRNYYKEEVDIPCTVPGTVARFNESRMEWVLNDASFTTQDPHCLLHGEERISYPGNAKGLMTAQQGGKMHNAFARVVNARDPNCRVHGECGLPAFLSSESGRFPTIALYAGIVNRPNTDVAHELYIALSTKFIQDSSRELGNINAINASVSTATLGVYGNGLQYTAHMDHVQRGHAQTDAENDVLDQARKDCASNIRQGKGEVDWHSYLAQEGPNDAKKTPIFAYSESASGTYTTLPTFDQTKVQGIYPAMAGVKPMFPAIASGNDIYFYPQLFALGASAWAGTPHETFGDEAVIGMVGPGSSSTKHNSENGSDSSMALGKEVAKAFISGDVPAPLTRQASAQLLRKHRKTVDLIIDENPQVQEDLKHLLVTTVDEQFAGVKRPDGSTILEKMDHTSSWGSNGKPMNGSTKRDVYDINEDGTLQIHEESIPAWIAFTSGIFLLTNGECPKNQFLSCFAKRECYPVTAQARNFKYPEATDALEFYTEMLGEEKAKDLLALDPSDDQSIRNLYHSCAGVAVKVKTRLVCNVPGIINVAFRMLMAPIFYLFTFNPLVFDMIAGLDMGGPHFEQSTWQIFKAGYAHNSDRPIFRVFDMDVKSWDKILPATVIRHALLILIELVFHIHKRFGTFNDRLRDMAEALMEWWDDMSLFYSGIIFPVSFMPSGFVGTLPLNSLVNQLLAIINLLWFCEKNDMKPPKCYSQWIVHKALGDDSQTAVKAAFIEACRVAGAPLYSALDYIRGMSDFGITATLGDKSDGGSLHYQPPKKLVFLQHVLFFLRIPAWSAKDIREVPSRAADTVLVGAAPLKATTLIKMLAKQDSNSVVAKPYLLLDQVRILLLELVPYGKRRHTLFVEAVRRFRDPMWRPEGDVQLDLAYEKVLEWDFWLSSYVEKFCEGGHIDPAIEAVRNEDKEMFVDLVFELNPDGIEELTYDFVAGFGQGCSKPVARRD